jgi:hypothetical protein
MSMALANRELGRDAWLRIKSRDYQDGILFFSPLFEFLKQELIFIQGISSLSVSHNYGLLPPAGASREPSVKAFWCSSRKPIHAANEANNVYLAAWDLEKPTGMASGKKQPIQTVESVEAERTQAGKKGASQAQAGQEAAVAEADEEQAAEGEGEWRVKAEFVSSSSASEVEASSVKSDDDGDDDDDDNDIESEDRSVSPSSEAPHQRPQTGGERARTTRTAAVAAAQSLCVAASAPQKRHVAFADNEHEPRQKRSRTTEAHAPGSPPWTGGPGCSYARLCS